MTLKFREWEFEFDKELNSETYKKISVSGADSCLCNNCKNHVAYRDKVFSKEVLQLFIALGIDFKKEVEIVSYAKLSSGLHHIGGWFHFNGKILKGKIDGVLEIDNNFSIGFTEDNALTFFENKNGLVQVDFMTSIPWVIDKLLETE